MSELLVTWYALAEATEETCCDKDRKSTFDESNCLASEGKDCICNRPDTSSSCIGAASCSDEASPAVHRLLKPFGLRLRESSSGRSIREVESAKCFKPVKKLF